MTERLLGRGAMAAVYLCRDEAGAPVAVKWLDLCMPGAGPEEASLTPPLLRRFEAEVRALARLRHPGVVGYRAHGTWQDRPYLVMDHVEGSDLRVYTGKLALRPSAERHARCRTIGQALCEALGAMHALGLVHRDVKPSNVLVDQSDRVVLTDLGVVKDLAETDRTQAGLVVGTVAYAAPEQLEGLDVDPRTDLYGVGATLYYVLTGRRPHDQGRRRLAQDPPVPPSRLDPELPADLEAVILRLMAPRPADRFPDAAAAARALAEGSPIAAPAMAGRGRVVQELTRVLDGIEGHGGSLVLEVRGPMGVGRSWLSSVVRAAAGRRGLTVVEPAPGAATAVALHRAATEAGVVVLTPRPLEVPEGVARAELSLHPLGIADVRRTVVAAAPLATAPSQLADRLHRWTGGLPALLLPLLDRYLDGARLALPPTCPVLPEVEPFLEALDLDALEVLGAMAMVEEALPPEAVEAIALVPPEEALATLEARGLVRRLGELWMVSAGMFREAARARLADPEGMSARAQAWLAQAGAAAPMGAVDPTELALDGRLAEALAAARACLDRAQAHGERALESEALCALGQVQLDLGQHEAARRTLANASALAKAAEAEPARRRSHLLRARAALDSARVGGASLRASAASALDRLVPLAVGADERQDPLDASIFATWSRASAALGDARAARQARQRAEFRLGSLPDGLHSRTVLELARAAGADPEAVDRALALLRPDQAVRPLVAWEAATLRAVAHGSPPPPPPAVLVQDLDPEARAALAERAPG